MVAVVVEEAPILVPRWALGIAIFSKMAALSLALVMMMVVVRARGRRLIQAGFIYWLGNSAGLIPMQIVAMAVCYQCSGNGAGDGPA